MSENPNNATPLLARTTAILIVSFILVFVLYEANKYIELTQIEQSAVESIREAKGEQSAVPYVEMLGFRLGEPLSKREIDARLKKRGYEGVDNIINDKKGEKNRLLYVSEPINVSEGIREYHYVEMQHHQVAGIGIRTSYDSHGMCAKEYQAYLSALTNALGEIGPIITYREGGERRAFEHGNVFSLNKCQTGSKEANAMTLYKPGWELAIEGDGAVFVLPFQDETRDPLGGLDIRLTEPDTSDLSYEVSSH